MGQEVGDASLREARDLVGRKATPGSTFGHTATK